MKTRASNLIFKALVGASLIASSLHSQTARPKDEPLLLNPFEVTTDTKGYMATNSISGTAMNTPLREVPMAISVITSEFIADTSANDMTDILKMNAAVTMRARPSFGSRLSSWTVRGFSIRALLVDGITAGNSIPPQLIDRVEIVKGPNTLYGQSDPGGIINIITKRPLPTQQQKLTASAGSDGQLAVDLDLSVPLKDGLGGVRLLTGFNETDGYRIVDGEQVRYAGLVGNYRVGERTTLLLNASGREAQGLATERSAFSFEIIPTDLNRDGIIDGTVVKGVRENTARFNASFLPRNYCSATAKNKTDWSNWYLGTGLRHEFNQAISVQYNYVNTQQGLGFTARDYNTFSAAGSADARFDGGDVKNITDAHTLQFALSLDTGPLKHRILLGGRSTEDFSRSNVYLLRSLGPANERAALSQLVASGRNIRPFLTKSDVIKGSKYWEDDVPTLSELFTLGSRDGNVDFSLIDVNSAYITDSISLLDNRIKLLAGLRYIQIESSSTSTAGALIGGLQKSSDTSYQAGAVYDITPKVAAFANTATSFNPNPPDPQTGFNREPERSLAYEIGVKLEGLFDNRISGSVSLFKITKENLVRSDYNPVTFSNTTEISDDESKGFDAEFFLGLTSNWQVVLGYTYIDSKVVKSQTAALGLPLEGAPPHKTTIWTSYQIGSGPLKGLRFGGGAAMVSGPIHQFGTSSNRLILQKSYNDFNVFMRYETKLGKKNMSLGFNVTNLTDEFYLESRGGSNTPRQFIFSTSIDL